MLDLYLNLNLARSFIFISLLTVNFPPCLIYKSTFSLTLSFRNESSDSYPWWIDCHHINSCCPDLHMEFSFI